MPPRVTDRASRSAAARKRLAKATCQRGQDASSRPAAITYTFREPVTPEQYEVKARSAAGRSSGAEEYAGNSRAGPSAAPPTVPYTPPTTVRMPHAPAPGGIPGVSADIPPTLPPLASLGEALCNFPKEQFEATWLGGPSLNTAGNTSLGRPAPFFDLSPPGQAPERFHTANRVPFQQELASRWADVTAFVTGSRVCDAPEPRSGANTPVDVDHGTTKSTIGQYQEAPIPAQAIFPYYAPPFRPQGSRPCDTFLTSPFDYASAGPRPNSMYVFSAAGPADYAPQYSPSSASSLTPFLTPTSTTDTAFPSPMLTSYPVSYWSSPSTSLHEYPAMDHAGQLRTRNVQIQDLSDGNPFIEPGGEEREWVCCGVPAEHAYRQWDREKLFRFSKMQFEYRGQQMIGGCKASFTKKDSLVWHIAQHGCPSEMNPAYL
ncbi:hypothetical protein C8Q78DRAFT_994012 [Trametes maxima]|nr:hypothetical protein C8Q78DRAFT_994012 [Trametes maxima]